MDGILAFLSLYRLWVSAVIATIILILLMVIEALIILRRMNIQIKDIAYFFLLKMFVSSALIFPSVYIFPKKKILY